MNKQELLKCAAEIDSIIAALESEQQRDMSKVSSEMGFGTVSKNEVSKSNPLMDFIFS